MIEYFNVTYKKADIYHACLLATKDETTVEEDFNILKPDCEFIGATNVYGNLKTFKDKGMPVLRVDCSNKETIIDNACFAGLDLSLMTVHNKRELNKALDFYEFDNDKDNDTVIRLADSADIFPFTIIAFDGGDIYSLKAVCDITGKKDYYVKNVEEDPRFDGMSIVESYINYYQNNIDDLKNYFKSDAEKQGELRFRHSLDELLDDELIEAYEKYYSENYEGVIYYSIKGWERKSDRNDGLSCILNTRYSLKDAISEAYNQIALYESVEIYAAEDNNDSDSSYEDDELDPILFIGPSNEYPENNGIGDNIIAEYQDIITLIKEGYYNPKI